SVNLERGFSRGVRNQPPMKQEFQFRFSAVLLGLLTVAAIVFSVLNLRQEKQMPVPYDGVWWVESQLGGNGRLMAQRVDANGPGDRAGIKAGDRLNSVAEAPIHSSAGLMRQLYKGGIYSRL